MKVYLGGFVDVWGMWEKDEYKDFGLRSRKEGVDIYWDVKDCVRSSFGVEGN